MTLFKYKKSKKYNNYIFKANDRKLINMFKTIINK